MRAIWILIIMIATPAYGQGFIMYYIPPYPPAELKIVDKEVYIKSTGLADYFEKIQIECPDSHGAEVTNVAKDRIGEYNATSECFRWVWYVQDKGEVKE